MDEDRKGRPPFMVTGDNVTRVKNLVLQDKRITVKQLLSDLGISVGSIELILYDHLNMNKVHMLVIFDLSAKDAEG